MEIWWNESDLYTSCNFSTNFNVFFSRGHPFSKRIMDFMFNVVWTWSGCPYECAFDHMTSLANQPLPPPGDLTSCDQLHPHLRYVGSLTIHPFLLEKRVTFLHSPGPKKKAQKTRKFLPGKMKYIVHHPTFSNSYIDSSYFGVDDFSMVTRWLSVDPPSFSVSFKYLDMNTFPSQHKT